MKYILVLMIVLLSGIVYAVECIAPYDGMTIKESLFLCNDAFDLPNGLAIGADNIILNCNDAILRGELMNERGILVENRRNVTITNCNILTFRVGIHLKNTTHSTIRRSRFLKNDIGISLFEAYENSIEDNQDDSTKTPVSSVTSKFNTVIFTNKVLDKAFCDVNNCNNLKDIIICVDDDFYCSDKCDHTTDNDCPGGAEDKLIQEKSKTFEDIEEEVRREFVEEPKEKLTVIKKKGMSWWIYLIVYVLTIIIGFFIVQYHAYKKKPDSFRF